MLPRAHLRLRQQLPQTSASSSTCCRALAIAPRGAGPVACSNPSITMSSRIAAPMPVRCTWMVNRQFLLASSSSLHMRTMSASTFMSQVSFVRCCAWNSCTCL
eukprot:541674-Alexandrium_andersonii.AAC.2